MTVDDTGNQVGDLLRAANQLLASAMPGTYGIWPRAAAFLIRMALEQALDEFWHREQYPGLMHCSMRAQLVCAREFLDEATAHRLASTWAALSSACHYHTYELAPTAAELRRWHEDTAALAKQLAALAR